MGPYDELPNPASGFQQAQAQRSESGRHQTVFGPDRSRIVSTAEKIIETGGQPA